MGRAAWEIGPSPSNSHCIDGKTEALEHGHSAHQSHSQRVPNSRWGGILPYGEL